MSAVFLCLSLLGWNLAGIRWTNDHYYGPLCGACTLAVALYVLALFGFLQLGAQFLLVAGVAYLGWELFAGGAWKRRRDQAVLAVGVAFFLLSAIHSAGWHFHAWDEFTHWGLVLRQFETFHSLPANGEEYLPFAVYVPGMAVFRYLAGVWQPGNESAYYLINWYLTYLGLLAMVGAVQHRLGLAGQAIVFALGFFGYTLFFQALASTVYVDAVLALLLLVGLLRAAPPGDTPRQLFTLLPLVALVVLTKHVGLLFALMIIGMVVVHDWQGRRDVALRARVFAPGVLLITVGLSYFSWEAYVSVQELKAGTALHYGVMREMSFSQLYEFFRSNALGVLMSKFPHAMFEQSAGYFGFRYEQTDVWPIVLVSLGMAAAPAALLPVRARREFLLRFAYLLLCLFAYLMFLAMVRGLTQWASDIWSFSRYFCTVLFAVVFFQLIDFIAARKSTRAASVVAVVVMVPSLVISPAHGDLFLPAKRKLLPERIQAQAVSAAVAARVEPSATLLYIYNGNDEYSYFLTAFELFPMRLLYDPHNLDFFSDAALQRPMDERSRPEAFQQQATRADYVVVYQPNPEFWARYGQFFSDQDHVVYKVLHGPDGRVRLEGK